jgi:hypothetical protein
MRRTSPDTLISFLFMLCGVVPAYAAAPVEELKVDLAPLIEASAPKANRFAVNVPHLVSAADDGEWTGSGATRTWTYRVRIPSAVSMSFHAPLVRLPGSAVLRVAGREASTTYRHGDAARGTLWGRPLLGDTLAFSLTVDAEEVSAVHFAVGSLQAGYRALSRDIPDHPHYKSLRPQASAIAAACTENYACNETDANRNSSRATVVVLIGNLGQCTGTLLNNARGDGRPYILTARHCQNGDLAGGIPEAASSVTIYWDAVTPCGDVLDAFYGAAARSQSGARTVVEQQDAWLLELDQPPDIPEPFFAGWDATGTAFTGGYSVHHALGWSQQYTEWSGQAILQRIPGITLSSPYDPDFWGVVNSLGTVGSGD